MTKNKGEKKPQKIKISEEEKEEKRVENLNKEIRNHFEREQKFSELSKVRGAEIHQSICNNYTLKRLTNELNATIHTLNRLLDKSDHDVKIVENHREHAEEQHQRIIAFHSKIIEFILSLYHLFKNSMNRMYEEERDKLVEHFFDSNITQERILHERRVQYGNLANINSSLVKQRVNMWNEKLINGQIEIESWSFIKRENLQENKTQRENFVCQEIKSILKLFTRKSWPKSRLEEYQKVNLKEIEVNREYKKVCENVEKSMEIVKDLNLSLNEFEYKKLSRESELKSEQLYLLKLLKLSENRFLDEERSDKQKITNLVIVAEKAKQKVYKLLEKIKKIESIVKISSKYEKLNDQVLTQSYEAHTNEDLKSFFYNKLAQVKSDCLILKSSKIKLSNDNQKLQQLILEYQHERNLQHNYRLLHLNLTPSIGNIHQIAHMIPQIKNEIKMRKLYLQHLKFYSKMCKK